MEASTVSFAELARMSRRLVPRLLATGENRLELLAVELQEEHAHLLHALLLALGVAAFSLLGAMTLTAALVILLWPAAPVAALFVLSGVYGLAGFCLYRRLAGLARDWRSFSASLDQFHKDRKGLEELLA